MKHKLFFFLLMSIAVKSLSGEVKVRHTDVSIRLLNPSNGCTIYSPITILTKFSIVNEGPDTLYSGDSIRIEIRPDTFTKPPRRWLVFTKSMIIPGDSEIFEYLVPINIKYYANKVALGVYIYGIINRNPLNPLSTEWPDEIWNNDGRIIFSNVYLKFDIIQSKNDWKIWPNPSNELLTFRKNNLPNGKEIGVSIIDLCGRVVYNSYVLCIDNAYTINVSNLESGIYQLRLESERERYYDKFVIKR